jgi:hypothetical protein
VRERRAATRGVSRCDLVDELYLDVYPLALGRGKRVFPATGIDCRFALAKATNYPTGVVGLHDTRA